MSAEVKRRIKRTLTHTCSVPYSTNAMQEESIETYKIMSEGRKTKLQHIKIYMDNLSLSFFLSYFSCVCDMYACM